MKLVRGHHMETIITFLTPKKLTFYLSEDNTLRQALEKFDAHKFTVVPILDEEGKFVTTLSQGDVITYVKDKGHFDINDCEKTLIKDLEIYRPYQPVRVDANVDEVFLLSLEQNFIPVVDDLNTYIGIIKRRDVIRYLYNKDK